MKLDKYELTYIFSIKKEIDFILKECGSNISYALSVERKRKAIFLSIINIKEALQKLTDKNKSITSFFNEGNIKRLSASRNFIAHFNEKLNLRKIENLIKYDLVEIRKSILNIAEKAKNIRLTKKSSLTRAKFWLAWTIRIAYLLVVYWLLFGLALYYYNTSLVLSIALVILAIFLTYFFVKYEKFSNFFSNDTKDDDDTDPYTNSFFTNNIYSNNYYGSYGGPTSPFYRRDND